MPQIATFEVYFMAIPKPFPLYPTYLELMDMELHTYPNLNDFFTNSPSWVQESWSWGRDFLLYIGRNKSEHTYIRFRSEVEKFLLWLFLVHDKQPDELRKTDLLDYADFYWKPYKSWIGFSNFDKFLLVGGLFKTNSDWRPFKLLTPKGDASDATPDKKNYRPSQQSMQSMFTALNSFFKHLMDEEWVLGNPVQLAKKDCKYLIKDTQVKDIKRLSTEQWDYVLSVAMQLADTDLKYERSLFLVTALKTLFLRISELSERRDWIPIMGHFWEDHEKNWWLKIYGKGRKLRDISVPTNFLTYLERYRQSRDLPSLPSKNENYPIVAKIRGSGGMTARQLSRLVQEVFDLAYEKMKSDHGPKTAQRLKEASTHWLRHTGASLEIERGRALKDLSEDLGHSSMATTDTVYVQSDDQLRAESGKRRKV